MEKRFLLVLGVALISWSMIQAEQVSENKALGIAAQFMKHRGLGLIAATQPTRMMRHNAATPQSCAYYVFNAQKDKGFVIVSGDDRTEPVLGYSDKGNFDPANVPENMQALLDQYVEEIAMLDAGVITQDKPQVNARPKNINAVSPLLSSQWAEGAPFNFQCPQSDGNYCVTGCVATAMAQIMYYHRWPSSTSQTIPGYTQSSDDNYTMHGTTYPALGTNTFNWNAMNDYYSSSETSTTATANAAVARLMRYCGQAVQMDYGVNSSGAIAQSEVYVDYFRFSRKARKLFRFDYSYATWENYIQAELAAGRPIVYGGRKHSGGHSFVCDGYDGNGYYHINWGWRGGSDGYFLLTALNPSGGGIGSASGNNGYMLGNYIVIGLEPNTVSTSERNSVAECFAVSAQKDTYTRSSSSDPFVITVGCFYSSYTVVSRTYDLTWGIFDSSGFTQIAHYGNPHNATFDYIGDRTDDVTRTLNFGKDYTDGTYYLRPICRESGGPNWIPCHRSGLNYIKAVINGNTLTLTAYNTSIGTFGSTTIGTASITEYSTIKKLHRPLEVKVKVTKNGLADYLPLYLFANNKLLGGNAINLKNSSSGYVTISYSPVASGNNNIEITGDPSGNYVYCTGSVDVAAASAANLSMTITGGNTNNNQTADNYLHFRFKVTNNLSTAYYDYIFGRIYKKDATGNFYIYRENMIPLNLAGSSNTLANYTFSNLEPGEYYVRFYYYNYDNEVCALISPVCQVGLVGDVNGDGHVNSSDVTTLYNYLLNGNTTGLVNGDVNNDGSINSGDITAVYDILLGN